MPSAIKKPTGAAVAAGIVVTLAAMIAFRPVQRWFQSRHVEAAATPSRASLPIAVDPEDPHAVRVSHDVVSRLGIKVVTVGETTIAETLKLTGELAPDPARVQHVRARFRGEIVELGKTSDSARTIQVGDSVVAGQFLAAVWSRELGETKSQLVDAVVQLDLDTKRLKSLEAPYREGAVPEREYREAARAVDADANDLARITRTLQMWQIDQEEISAVRAEADRLLAQGSSSESESADQWARFEIRAVQPGVIINLDAALGDVVAEDDALLTIGDLSRLQVVAFAYEEDAPRLDRLPEGDRSWTISVPAAPDLPPQSGGIERLGETVDPVQHTVPVMGWVDNSQKLLRAGQFVTAEVHLPPPPGEVGVPATAVVEKGAESLVYVQRGDEPVFTRRRISLARIVGQVACIRREPPDGQDADIKGLKPGERVVSSGAVELEQALTDLQATQSSAPSSEPDDS